MVNADSISPYMTQLRVACYSANSASISDIYSRHNTSAPNSCLGQLESACWHWDSSLIDSLASLSSNCSTRSTYKHPRHCVITTLQKCCIIKSCTEYMIWGYLFIMCILSCDVIRHSFPRRQNSLPPLLNSHAGFPGMLNPNERKPTPHSKHPPSQFPC
jgi:hypothetical protein